jgi:hypothetical protein
MKSSRFSWVIRWSREENLSKTTHWKSVPWIFRKKIRIGSRNLAMTCSKKEEPPKVAAYLSGVLNWVRFFRVNIYYISSAFNPDKGCPSQGSNNSM